MPRNAIPTESVNELDIGEVVTTQEQTQIFFPALRPSWLNGNSTFWSWHYLLTGFYKKLLACLMPTSKYKLRHLNKC